LARGARPRRTRSVRPVLAASTPSGTLLEMRALIRDLLAFSRAGRGGGAMERVAVDRVLDRVLADLRPAIEESRASIERGPLPTVVADASELGQILQNLVANAIKFRRAGAPVRIRISAERDDGSWLFSVSDNGIGIDPRYANRVFAIFQRLHSRAEYPGTGVGLAICKKIVERQGGKIWFDSTGRRGSTFRFTIPAAPVAQASAPSMSHATA
jgi:light-regulated signal transduction histidine kinase (bacteriophytochrome)